MHDPSALLNPCMQPQHDHSAFCQPTWPEPVHEACLHRALTPLSCAAAQGDAAGYVTKCSGEGIYFAAKSGRMAAEAIVEASQRGAWL